MSVTIALLFFFTVYCLEMIGKGIWFRPWIRDFLGDYAYPVSLVSSRTLPITHLSTQQLIQKTHDVRRSPHCFGPDLLISLANYEPQTS